MQVPKLTRLLSFNRKSSLCIYVPSSGHVHCSFPLGLQVLISGINLRAIHKPGEDRQLTTYAVCRAQLGRCAQRLPIRLGHSHKIAAGVEGGQPSELLTQWLV